MLFEGVMVPDHLTGLRQMIDRRGHGGWHLLSPSGRIVHTFDKRKKLTAWWAKWIRRLDAIARRKPAASKRLADRPTQPIVSLRTSAGARASGLAYNAKPVGWSAGLKCSKCGKVGRMSCSDVCYCCNSE